MKNFFSSKGKGKKPAKGAQQMKYEEFVSVVNGELLWKELENKLDNLKSIYLHQLSVRSATSIGDKTCDITILYYYRFTILYLISHIKLFLDEVPVLFEGDTYPLKEIASISKKDPKKVIIDASAFPQASVNIMAALRDSGMNLNPQQEGLTIYVPIPKVTKEFREKLAGGAKKKLNECKDELRKVQNKFAKQVSEKELSGAVAKDDARASSETIKAITDHFMAQGDQLLSSKTKDILGK